MKAVPLVFALSLLVAYLLWVFLSFAFVQFPKPPDEIKVPQWPQDGYYKLRPGRYENPRYHTFYTVNRHGFRGSDFQPEPSRRPRIIVIGESSTAGLDSNDDETWPARLAYHLSSRGHQVEVINAGIPGIESTQHLAMLTTELVRYRPDLILYYAGRNDHAAFAIERYPGPDVWHLDLTSFVRYWFFYKRIQLRLLSMQALGLDPDTWMPWSNATWTNRYRQNLSQMLTADDSIPFLVISQVLDYPADVMTDATAGRVLEVATKLSMRQAGWQELLRHADLLRLQRTTTARFPDAHFLDIYPEFLQAKKSGVQLFHDIVHLTPAGNDVLAVSVAEAIAPSIERSGRIRPSYLGRGSSKDFPLSLQIR